MNILSACKDPNVFGPAFRNRHTWRAWFAFLASLFALPMTPEQQRIYRTCTHRTSPPTERALVCGRRSGKSFMLALIAVYLAAFVDWRPHLGPGERATVMIVAADRKQARTIMRFIKGLLRAVPILRQLIEHERIEGIDLTNQITIEIHTASFRTVRGYTVVAALLDELAFWPTEDSASPDAEVINAIRPAMATVPDALLLCASSPYARKGALWEAYHKYFGKAGPVLVWQAPTRTMNGTVPQSFIDAEMEKDPANAAAEFLAEFRTDLEAFVSREAVESCIEWSCHERPYVAGRRYTAFCDPSGGSSDSMTLAIAHPDKDVAVLDLIREVKAPFSPENAAVEFADTLKAYKLSRVTGDRYGGAGPTSAFARHGIKYIPSEYPKGAIYLDTLPLINSAKVRLLANSRMVAQFVGLERNTARGGKDSIDHGRGGHDDIANAVAGACLAALAKKARIWTGGGLGHVGYRPELNGGCVPNAHGQPRRVMGHDDEGNLLLKP